MTVVVTDRASVPRVAPAGELLGSTPASLDRMRGADMWRPELAPSGPVSIVVSGADHRVAVLRNGTLIGSAAVTIEGTVERTSAFILNRMDGTGRHWLQVTPPGQQTGAPGDLRGRIEVADAFRRQVEAVLEPGATVVVTPDSLIGGGSGRVLTVIEGDSARRP